MTVIQELLGDGSSYLFNSKGDLHAVGIATAMIQSAQFKMK